MTDRMLYQFPRCRTVYYRYSHIVMMCFILLMIFNCKVFAISTDAGNGIDSITSTSTSTSTQTNSVMVTGTPITRLLKGEASSKNETNSTEEGTNGKEPTGSSSESGNETPAADNPRDAAAADEPPELPVNITDTVATALPTAAPIKVNNETATAKPIATTATETKSPTASPVISSEQTIVTPAPVEATPAPTGKPVKKEKCEDLEEKNCKKPCIWDAANEACIKKTMSQKLMTASPTGSPTKQPTGVPDVVTTQSPTASPTNADDNDDEDDDDDICGGFNKRKCNNPNLPCRWDVKNSVCVDKSSDPTLPTGATTTTGTPIQPPAPESVTITKPPTAAPVEATNLPTAAPVEDDEEGCTKANTCQDCQDLATTIEVESEHRKTCRWKDDQCVADLIDAELDTPPTNDTDNESPSLLTTLPVYYVLAALIMVVCCGITMRRMRTRKTTNQLSYGRVGGHNNNFYTYPNQISSASGKYEGVNTVPDDEDPEWDWPQQSESGRSARKRGSSASPPFDNFNGTGSNHNRSNVSSGNSVSLPTDPYNSPRTEKPKGFNVKKSGMKNPLQNSNNTSKQLPSQLPTTNTRIPNRSIQNLPKPTVPTSDDFFSELGLDATKPKFGPSSPSLSTTSKKRLGAVALPVDASNDKWDDDDDLDDLLD